MVLISSGFFFFSGGFFNSFSSFSFSFLLSSFVPLNVPLTPHLGHFIAIGRSGVFMVILALHLGHGILMGLYSGGFFSSSSGGGGGVGGLAGGFGFSAFKVPLAPHLGHFITVGRFGVFTTILV